MCGYRVAGYLAGLSPRSRQDLGKQSPDTRAGARESVTSARGTSGCAGGPSRASSQTANEPMPGFGNVRCLGGP